VSRSQHAPERPVESVERLRLVFTEHDLLAAERSRPDGTELSASSVYATGHSMLPPITKVFEGGVPRMITRRYR
jgi:hypothetical protein